MDKKMRIDDFEGLLELDNLGSILKALKVCNKPACSEVLAYDSHGILVVDALLVKDFLKFIHFPTALKESKENIIAELEAWVEIIEENIVDETSGNQPMDDYLKEMLSKIKIEDDINPNKYPLIVYHGDRPFIPHWYALKFAKRALYFTKNRELEDKSEKQGDLTKLVISFLEAYNKK